MEKYGGEEHLEAPPKTLLLAQTEEYIEYSRSGKVVKGMEKFKARSRYEEDVFLNNHTTVWGSYWNGGRWGYKCCRSFIKVYFDPKILNYFIYFFASLEFILCWV